MLAVVGPTAVGKSALALELAETLGGEIVSADSRQVYRCMDVGTAKPSATDRARVPHHLVDVVDPDQEYSFALFLRQAAAAIRNIRARGRLPILAGGSGQYVWGLLEGWTPPSVPPDPDLRRRLEAQAQERGYAALHARLREIDPEAAARIDPRNVRRVVRALEVACAARRRGEAHPASPRKKESPPFDSLVLGLYMDRQALYQRIDRRVDAMIEAGWLDEVRGAAPEGLHRRPSIPIWPRIRPDGPGRCGPALPRRRGRRDQDPHPPLRPPAARMVPPDRRPHPLVRRHPRLGRPPGRGRPLAG